MADIKFYANVDTAPSLIRHDLGSGLGFYGAAYGVSVPIGQTQDTTFVTNSNGTATDQYGVNNTKRVSSTQVEKSIGTVSAMDVKYMPNYHCPLRISFSHTEAVAVQNCKLRIFDRYDIGDNASGVTTYVYESRHPHLTDDATSRQLDQRGDSENAWIEFDGIAGTPSDMNFTASPGLSGWNSNSNDAGAVKAASHWNDDSHQSTEGITHRSLQHDWYCALSAEPESIGSKTYYGLYFTLEYL